MPTAAVTPILEYNYNQDQQAFFALVQKELATPGCKFIIVDSVAGSGKTTAITGALNYCGNANVLITCFNRANQQTMVQRLGSQHPKVKCQTVHSLGFKLLGMHDPRFIGGACEDKFFHILHGVYTKQNLAHEIKRRDPENARSNYKTFKTLINLVLANCLDTSDSSAIAQLAIRHGIVSDVFLQPSNLVYWYCRISERTAKTEKAISYSDAIYLSLLWGLKHPLPYDVIFVDEYQDLNKAHLRLILSHLSENGLLVLVGDKHQSLYGWNGALVRSDIVQECSTLGRITETSLSVCYRCPPTHLDLVRSWVGNIQPAATNKPGTVYSIDINQITRHLEPSSLILSRNVAPLIPLLIKLRQESNFHAFIKGGDIGGVLKDIVKALPDVSGKTISDRIVDYFEVLNEKSTTAMQQEQQDKKAVLAAIIKADQVVTKRDLCKAIDKYFDDKLTKLDSIVLSTIHKAKGMEANRVFVLGSNKLPRRYKNQPRWSIEEENNCVVVAFTRSRRDLFLCEGALE